MHRIALILLCVLLMACNTAGRGFGGLPATRVTEGGATFDLRRQGDLVEAIRVSKHALPRYDWVAQRAALAAFRTYGCTPDWALGDPSVVRLGLACDGRAAPRAPPGKEVLVCDVTAWRVPGQALAEGQMICR